MEYKYPQIDRTTGYAWNAMQRIEQEIGLKPTAMGRVEYKNWRDLVFRQDNFTCQMCDQRGGCLHADHIKSWIDYPQFRYVVSNGRTLCRACHYFVTFKKKMSVFSKWGLTRASAQEA